MNYVCSAAHMCAHVCMRVFPDCWEETVLSPYLDPSRDVDTTPGSEDRILCMHHAPWEKGNSRRAKRSQPRTPNRIHLRCVLLLYLRLCDRILGIRDDPVSYVHSMHAFFKHNFNNFLQKTLEESSPQQSVFGPFPAFH